MEKEIWDIYDSCFQKTGKFHVRGEKIPVGCYHLVVHIYPVNNKKQLLVQKRSDTVDWFPGIWAATGGSALTKEDAWDACKRELYEELGVRAKKDNSEMIALFKRDDSFNAVWIIKTDVNENDIIVQPEEVACAKWFYPEKIRTMVKEGIFHNYLYMEWLFEYIEKME